MHDEQSKVVVLQLPRNALLPPALRRPGLRTSGDASQYLLRGL